ncbi:MAG: aminotransferase class I/II-fold pyridoxal phosphate-dependent enzyme [Elusimicrobiota bacterium]|jgi:hypothetical protein
MSDPKTFGEKVIEESKKLLEAGLDANQIAGALCRKDPQGKNYGIGNLLEGDGKPMATSSTLLDYAKAELMESTKGNYLNSEALMGEMTESVLRWQGIPETLWPHFTLLLPSDAGTGAVQTAIQAALLSQPGLTTLAVEKLGWPAYRALANTARLQFQEFPSDGVATGAGVLPLYQAGPLNTTGHVSNRDIVQKRARDAKGAPVILDRAYSGFELARHLDEMPYEDLMRKSFQGQVEPFVEAETSFFVALSPTKAFVTFALRPCGMLLAFTPERTRKAEITRLLTGIIRARGSSFEHPVTRAFVKAMVKDRARLQAEHSQALRRVANAQALWKKLSKGTAIEALFSETYAGLFRNPKVQPGAAAEIYGAHFYPVFTQDRCRLNITGLPSNETQAAAHVALFARHCEGA